MWRGVNSPHRRSDAQEDLEMVLHVSIGYGLEEGLTPMPVIRERNSEKGN